MTRMPRRWASSRNATRSSRVPEVGVDGEEVADVVAAVAHGRRVVRQQPQAVDAEPLEIVELGPQAGQVADAVVVGVEEAPGEHLVEHGPAVPVGRALAAGRAVGADPGQRGPRRRGGPAAARRCAPRAPGAAVAGRRHGHDRRRSAGQRPTNRARPGPCSRKESTPEPGVLGVAHGHEGRDLERRARRRATLSRPSSMTRLASRLRHQRARRAARPPAAGPRRARRSRGTTRSARPMRSASSAPTWRPVKMRSLARPGRRGAAGAGWRRRRG